MFYFWPFLGHFWNHNFVCESLMILQNILVTVSDFKGMVSSIRSRCEYFDQTMCEDFQIWYQLGRKNTEFMYHGESGFDSRHFTTS